MKMHGSWNHIRGCRGYPKVFFSHQLVHYTRIHQVACRARILRRLPQLPSLPQITQCATSLALPPVHGVDVIHAMLDDNDHRDLPHTLLLHSASSPPSPTPASPSSSAPRCKLPAPKVAGVSGLHQCQWIRGCMFTMGQLHA